MLITSDNYKQKVIDYGREFINEVTITDGLTTEVYNGASVVITETLVENSLINIGKAFVKEAVISFRDPQDTLQYGYSTYTIRSGLKVGNDYEYVPMGTFYPQSIERTSEKIEIKCYDKLLNLNEDYTVSGTDTQVLTDLADRYGLTYKANYGKGITLPEITEPAINVLGYIAGLSGANAIMNRYNQVEFKKYEEVEFSIGPGQIKQNGTNIKGNNLVIGGISSGTDLNPIEVGSGLSIVSPNPFMTQEILNEIGDEMLPFGYSPLEVNYYGNPAIEVGDRFTLTDLKGNEHQLIVSKQVITLKGGCSIEIISAGDSDNELTYTYKSSVDKKIIANNSALIKSMDDATKNILGVNGGYFSLLIDENSGQPYGFRIMNTATITPTTKGWQGDYNGIGYSNDGFNTITKVALDMSNGQITADNLVSGAVITSRVDINNTLALRDWVLSTNVGSTSSTFDLIYLGGTTNANNS